VVTSFEALLAAARDLPPLRVAVVNPANAETFEAIRSASERLPISFLLTGEESAMRDGLKTHGIDSAKVTITGTHDTDAAIRSAIGAVASGEAGMLMKGSVDTATLMKAVLTEGSGLRTGRTLSDVFIFEYPDPRGKRLVMITDGGLNLAPDLKTKVDLILNAVAVAHALGNPRPLVAVLSASEFVNPALPSSVDAALLAKMNERGLIPGCVVDGPLALDNAISSDAAHEKNIGSAVAGRADILLAPGIEAANLLAKSTTYFAGYPLGHVIVGAAAPILIPSRADKCDAKVHSIALGMVMANQKENAKENTR
jgi:phosphate butyryltransferase